MAGRKRKAAAAADAPAPETPAALSSSRRQSQRITSSAKKSRYFEGESESDSGPKAKRQAVAKKAQAPKSSGRNPKKTKEPESDDGDDYKEEQGDEPKEQPENDSDEDFDEDAPPKVTFIPIPKLRDTGGVEYTDTKLHNNTLAFLKDLKANNKRTWLKCGLTHLDIRTCS